MAIVVQKYGGSSVADLAKLSCVADWVVASKRAGNDVVVVVSAMGKTTENLRRRRTSARSRFEALAPFVRAPLVLSCEF